MVPDTFIVPVPGVGDFECRRRNMRTAIAITAEYNRLVEGQTDVADDFAFICNMVAYVKAMAIRPPRGWDVDNLDPDSEDDLRKLREVFGAISATEARFRAGIEGNGQVAGKGTVGNVGVVVPQEIQPAADRPEIS